MKQNKIIKNTTLMNLFNDKEIKVSPNKGKTCLTCVHRERWEAGNSVIQYCGILKSNRTENGKLKIKCKTKACDYYRDNETK